MTPEETKRVSELVKQIEIEKDHAKFTQLVDALNALLDAKERRLDKGNPAAKLS
jgi:hypothetical protein